MTNRPTYNRFKTPIGASEEITVHNVGNLVSLLAATGAVEIALGDGAFIPLDVGQTVSFQDEEFDKVRIRDMSGATNNVDIYVGRGEFFDLRFSAAGNLTTKPVVPDTLSTGGPVLCVTGAATLLRAANPLRSEIVLVVSASAAGAVLVGGDPAAAAGQGVPVLPGQSIAITNTAAVYVRNDTGAAVNVWAMESEWSA